MVCIILSSIYKLFLIIIYKILISFIFPNLLIFAQILSFGVEQWKENIHKKWIYIIYYRLYVYFFGNIKLLNIKRHVALS